MVEEIKVFVKPGESMEGIERIIDQLEREWKNFDCDIRSEIKYLEFVGQQKEDASSETSKVPSRVSRKSHKSKLSSISDAEDERIQLQKEEAALKAKLAYIEKERKLVL